MEKSEAVSVTFAFSPDGRALAMGGATQLVTLWDARTGKRIRQFDGNVEQGTAILCFSSDGKRLATKEWSRNGTSAGSVRLWDVETGKEHCVNPHHRGPVQCVAYSPDGKYIVSAGDDRRVLWWGAKSGAFLPVAGPEHESPVRRLRFSADGSKLASACDKHILIWDVGTRKLAKRIPIKTPDMLGIGLTADGNELTTVHGDGAVHTWNTADGKHKAEFATFKKDPDSPQYYSLTQATFSPDGQYVATYMSPAHEVNIWSVANRKVVRSLAIGPPIVDPLQSNVHFVCTACVFSPDGRYVAANVHEQPMWRRHRDFSEPRSTTFVWEIASGEKALTVRDVAYNLGALAFTPDGRSLLHGAQSGSSLARYAYYIEGRSAYRHAEEDAAVLRDLSAGANFSQYMGTGPARICLATGWELPLVQGVLRSPSCIAFAPDGRSLVTIDKDRTLLVWDIESLEPRRTAPSGELDADEFEAEWTKLGQLNAISAHAAIWRMTQDPQGAVAFLKGKLKSPDAPADGRVQKLIADLDSAHFAIRAQAMRDLSAFAELAAPALRLALAQETRPERKRRLEDLLVGISDDLNAAQLQQKRGVEVLEKLDHPAAAELLQELSRRHPGARLTQDARAALERWQRRMTKS